MSAEEDEHYWSKTDGPKRSVKKAYAGGKHVPNKNEAKLLRKIMAETGLSEEEVRQYCYCVYSSYTVFYNSYHPLDKVTKKLYKIRYFFDMRSAILYAKHLHGQRLCWSISKNPLKRFMYKFKRSLNRIKIL